MTSSDGPTGGGPDTSAAVRTGRAAAGPEAVRQLADRLHASIDEAFSEWDADAAPNAKPSGARPANPTFARPLSAPPVRMEQLARTPEPTADLDDLVDLLVPRLVEQLVPALRAALKDDH